MGNPYMRRLPDSGIVVSISTAVYMAQPCNNWGETTPVQPDLPVDAMWRRQGNLDNTIRDWVTEPSHQTTTTMIQHRTTILPALVALASTAILWG